MVAEANVGENKDSSGGVEGDSYGNIGIGDGSGDRGWQQRTATVTAAKAGSALAAAVIVAKAVADNNRNCGGRQQSTKCGRPHR